MSILFVCNTYYQMIVATHMALSVYSLEECDVIFTDQSKGLKNVSEKFPLLEENPFRRIYYIETSNFNSCKGLAGYLRVLWSYFVKNRYRNIINCHYDEVVYYNFDFTILSLYDLILKKNQNVIFSRYEEGILSYHHQFFYKKMFFICRLRKMMRRGDPYKQKHFFYCFYPELYHGTEMAVPLPRIDTTFDKLKHLFVSIFDIDDVGTIQKEKYIFFTSVYDFEGGEPIGEYQAVSRIANAVGKGNLLIKKHPRDTRNIYEKNGFKVEKNSSIPWEVMQFQYDLTQTTLLSVNSGAIMSTSLLFGGNAKSFYVYELCDLSNNVLAQESINSIKELLNSPIIKLNFPNIQTLADLDELKKYE